MKHARTTALVLVLLSALYAATAPAQTAPATTHELPGEEESMLSMLRKGGPVMIAIGICSILAVTISVERFIALRKNQVVPPDFMDGLNQVLRRANPDIRAGIEYCEQSASPLGDVIRTGIRKLGKDPATVEKAVSEAAALQVDRMKRPLNGLAIIARVSPLLGLLGTVYGMIKAFQTASSAVGMGRADLLAQGIYEALVTTAAGLTVAIPALLLYHFLRARVDRFTELLDELGTRFLDEYAEQEGA